MVTTEIEEVTLTVEQEAQIDEAMLHASDPKDEVVAVKACFDVPTRLLITELKTGQRLATPQEDLEDLADADPEDLLDVEIVGPGTALHWEKLMQGLDVQALRQGIYGNQQWMEGLAQRRRERKQRAD